MVVPLPRVVLVADSSATAGRPLADVVREAVRSGIRGVWLREKHIGRAERRRLAAQLAQLLHEVGGVLLASPGAGAELADAVHLGAADPPPAGAVAGRSCHSRAELERAAKEGCLWATLSPIYPSPSKPGYGPALGTRALAAAPLATWALGGVNAANAKSCFEAGAAGVAVMGAVLGADRPTQAVEDLLANLEGVLA